MRSPSIERSREDLLHLADEELMALVADADADAFEVVYDRHIGAAYSLAFRMCGRGQAAEETCQEALLAAWRSAARYDPVIGSVRSWLLALVHYRAIERLRRATRHGAGIAGGDDAATLVAAADTTERGAHERLDRGAMRGLVVALPVEQRQAISLSFYSGYSTSEVARILDVSVGTVRSRMRRGLERLHTATEVVR